MVAQNSWKTQDIDGQEVRFTHAPIADTTDSTVHIMGTLELDGEWHDVVAEIVVTATGASTEHKVEARPTAEVRRRRHGDLDRRALSRGAHRAHARGRRCVVPREGPLAAARGPSSRPESDNTP